MSQSNINSKAPIENISFFETITVDREELPTPDETESLIAKQLANLSMRDREQVYYSLHGVTDEIEETPELIEESLCQLEAALNQIDEKKSYETAKVRNKEYVMNKDFVLMFLRAERFDAEATAQMLVRHFEVKEDLFGETLLCRDIVQDDLDEATMQQLYSGFNQILPSRDRAGRLVHVAYPGHRPPPTKESGIAIVSFNCFESVICSLSCSSYLLLLRFIDACSVLFLDGLRGRPRDTTKRHGCSNVHGWN